ncbi:unnamed protein product [Musa hybrid cultivar]
MLQGWKKYLFHSKEVGDGGGGGVRWGRISASVCFLVLLSLAFVCFSAFYSGDYGWSAATANIGLGPAAEAAAAVADPSPTNLSHIVFGIGGSARTWSRRRGYSELWWRPGVTRGHVWLDKAPPEGAWPAMSPPYRVSANASRFRERASASRIARIVAESQRLHAGDAGVRWFVMGDDDTVFFVDNLVATLGKYDHEDMYYVGAPSESVEQDVMHSYGLAFGGGGFAVSAPAAAELARALDGCLDRYAQLYGSDQRVHSCLSELGVPLTREPGFHQLDIRGDAYGLLAAHPVAPLVSLHHLDYLAPITPRGGDQLGALRTLMDAARLDPARILQQCFCYEAQRGFAWSVSVSWGYTVQLYPRVLAANDMEVPLRTFKTWRSFGDGPFTFNTRQVAPDRPCDRPLLYFLSSVKKKNGQDGSGSTMSEYSRYREEDGRCKGLPGYGAALKVETVKVFAPKMDPAAWRRGDYGRCCVSGTEEAVLPNASVMVGPYLGSTNKKLSPG